MLKNAEVEGRGYAMLLMGLIRIRKSFKKGETMYTQRNKRAQKQMTQAQAYILYTYKQHLVIRNCEMCSPDHGGPDINGEQSQVHMFHCCK